MPKRTVVDEEAFAADWESGVRVLDMAATYGVSQGAVSKMARKMGLASRNAAHGPRTAAPVRGDSEDVLRDEEGRWVPDRRGISVWEPYR